MNAPVVDARGDLLRYGRTLAVAYPDLARAAHTVVAELDRLARIEAAAVGVVDAAEREGVVEHAPAGRTLDALALALALEGRSST